MKKRRVLIIDNESLLIAGVLSILREHPEIELTAVNEDEGDLLRRIRQVAPQVVVIDAGGAGEEGGLSISQLLRENPRSALILVSLDQPVMQVFRTRRVQGTSPDSLLSIIEGATRPRQSIRGEKILAID